MKFAPNFDLTWEPSTPHHITLLPMVPDHLLEGPPGLFQVLQPSSLSFGLNKALYRLFCWVQTTTEILSIHSSLLKFKNNLSFGLTQATSEELLLAPRLGGRETWEGNEQRKGEERGHRTRSWADCGSRSQQAMKSWESKPLGSLLTPLVGATSVTVSPWTSAREGKQEWCLSSGGTLQKAQIMGGKEPGKL